jgi:hypothetical protein
MICVFFAFTNGPKQSKRPEQDTYSDNTDKLYTFHKLIMTLWIL